MRINVSEAYREEFEVIISKYQKLCNGIIDLVVENLLFEKLFTYCIHNHPDVMPRLTGTVSSSDIMRGIVDKCSITNITPLEEVIQHCNITSGIGMIVHYEFSLGEGMIGDYQRSLDEYLLKLRTIYLFGSKDIVNAETIIFILDWTPDDTSFPHIKHLLYKAFIDLNKNIIFQDTGKKNFASLKYFINYDVTTVPFHAKATLIILIHCFQFYKHTHCASISLLLYVV